MAALGIGVVCVLGIKVVGGAEAGEGSGSRRSDKAGSPSNSVPSSVGADDYCGRIDAMGLGVDEDPLDDRKRGNRPWTSSDA